MAYERGGIVIQLEGREVPVVFTNAALADAEARLGMSIMVVVQGFVNQRSGVTQVGALLRAGMEAGKKASKIQGRTPTIQDAYKIMDEIGLAKAIELIIEPLNATLRFGIEEEPEDFPN